MIRIPIFALLCCCCVVSLSAQDAYHSQLMTQLMTNYQLPAGTWISHNTETGNVNAATYYGDIQVNTADLSGQDFSKRTRIIVNSAGADPWASAWSIRNPKAISKGRKLLWVIWLRATNAGGGKINLFAEDAVSYQKEVAYTLPLAAEWTRYLIPFEAGDNYPVNDLTFGIHLALQAQTIEIGGFAVIDFGTAINLDQLPNETNNEFYGGYEADAPWRAEAAARIEQLRKADLEILVRNAAGDPLPNAKVEVRMLQHEYGFGTAVVACRFAGNRCQENTYQAKLTDLDGRGHGFNEVVFENSLKWPAWENHWIESQENTAKALLWLKARGIRVRGHNLVWPGADHLPQDVNNRLNDIAFVKDRINRHLEDILQYPGIKGNLLDWDVLNEITANRTLEFAFAGKAGYPTGRELYAEIFRKTKELAPEAVMYLNDYITISQDRSSGEIYERYQQYIRELLAAGAPLEGIGFQGHVGGFPVSIYTVYNILEDFYQQFGLESKITEFDLSPQVGDELAAKYLRDFLTINFSHPSSKGFLMWGFWDGNHWFQNAPMYSLDWTLKPAGQAFIDLVFNEWWTEGNLTTDLEGRAAMRGFKGTYEVIYQKNGQEQRDTFVLNEDLTLALTDASPNAVLPLSENPAVRMFPNPATDHLSIQRNNPAPAQLRIIDLTGKLLYQKDIRGTHLDLPLQLPAGLYTIHWREAEKLYYQKLLVH